MLAGFPIQLAAAATGTPAVCDCDGDGKTEIVTMDYGRTLYMWDYDNLFAPAGLSAWPQFHHDAEHTGNADTPITLDAGGAPPAPPRVLELAAPRPNPARDPVEIAWGVPADQAGQASEVAVFDLSGRRVQRIESGAARAGRHRARWDLRDERGTPARSGVYFVRVTTGRASLSRKLLLIR